MSGSMGWITESSIMPRRPKEINEVGKASMVDLHAALYATEAARSSQDPAMRAAEEDRRRNAGKHSQDAGLGRHANRGVHARRARDDAAEADAEAKRQDALRHKADI